MLQYFDKTFFKFSAGFLAIIFASVLISIATDYHDKKVKKEAQICCADSLPIHQVGQEE